MSYQINAVKPTSFNSSSAIPQTHSGFSVSSGIPIPCQVNNSIKPSDFSSVSALPPNYGWTIPSEADMMFNGANPHYKIGANDNQQCVIAKTLANQAINDAWNINASGIAFVPEALRVNLTLNSSMIAVHQHCPPK